MCVYLQRDKNHKRKDICQERKLVQKLNVKGYVWHSIYFQHSESDT